MSHRPTVQRLGKRPLDNDQGIDYNPYSVWYSNDVKTMAKLTPRERRQARTREEILDAALTLINEKGSDDFSLRELARRVDYSPAGLYEYFDSKDDIVAAVCHEGHKRLQNYLRAAPDTLPLDLYLVEMGLAYVRFAEQNEEHFRLMFTRVPEDLPIPYGALKTDETYGILLDAVQICIDARVVKPRPTYGLDEIAYGFWVLVHGMAMLRLTGLRNVEYDFEAANRRTLETFIRGLA